ncbi:MAG: transglutaminase [Flavobacteriales bacterium]|nr:transglutaminase [Flavobacteriales bacterium]
MEGPNTVKDGEAGKPTLVQRAVNVLVALVIALPASLALWPFVPVLGLPPVAGIGLERLFVFLIVLSAILLLMRRWPVPFYGAVVLALAVVTIFAFLGRYGLKDVFTDYGQMLGNLRESTEALPKVKELRPFKRAEEVRAAINYTDPVVRSFAVRAATTWFTEEAEQEPDFTLVQCFSIFKVINNGWVYVSDPMDDEYFAKASESVGLLAGDCDDHAVLMAASIKAIGGSVRLVRTTQHIYPELNVGNAEGMKRAAFLIRRVLFPEQARHAALYFHTDADGNHWINLDYTRHYPGGEVMDEKIVGILHV